MEDAFLEADGREWKVQCYIEAAKPVQVAGPGGLITWHKPDDLVILLGAPLPASLGPFKLRRGTGSVLFHAARSTGRGLEGTITPIVA